MRRFKLTMLAAIFSPLVFVLPALAVYSNPAAITPNSFQPFKAASTAASVKSGSVRLGSVRALTIQNQCGSPVYMQSNGVVAISGKGLEIAAGATVAWPSVTGGPIPTGPYSFITASTTCDPDTATGLSIYESIP